jgi:hypothetical protein
MVDETNQPRSGEDVAASTPPTAALVGGPSLASPAGAGQPVEATPEFRKAALAQHVAAAVATQGARVESQSDFQAVLLTGQKVNHTLHFLASVFTCGIWAIPWVFLVVTGGEKRHLIQVDEWGNVRVQHL